MNWESFKNTLLQAPGLYLQFQYAGTNRVDASYHITEIKQAPITSVDCGGVVNKWTEIIVQLYEPDIKDQQKPMQVKKALSIISVVEKAITLDPAATVKIEFGNNDFETRQLLPHAIHVEGEDLVIDLAPDAVQCKAIDRGGSCGPKPKADLRNLVVPNKCCTPDSACC